MRAININGLGHTFSSHDGPVEALHDLTFRVGPGEIVTVLGPSGCGKSTLLRVLAGLIQPTRGRVTIDGDTPATLRTRQAIGFGLQEPVLMDWRTVEENIRLPAELGAPPQKQDGLNERVEELLSVTGLVEFRRRFPPQLSGGMKHRVALARALLIAPEVLLLDEPLASLDLLTRTMLMTELALILARFRATTLVVTHSVDEAVFWGNRIIVLSGRPGTIVDSVTSNTSVPRSIEYMDSTEFHQIASRCRHVLLQKQHAHAQS